MNSWIDLKYATRLLAKKPALMIMTKLILAIGMGLCVYVYSLIYNMSIKDLPFENSERMVSFRAFFEGQQRGDNHTATAFEAMLNEAATFEKIGFFRPHPSNISGGDRATQIFAAHVQTNFFDITSTYPTLGRAFNSADSVEGAKPVAIISPALWREYFGDMKDIIGHEFTVDGEITEIVGVMPEGFGFPYVEKLWLPNKMDRIMAHLTIEPIFSVFGLLKEGVSVQEAETEINAIYQRLAQVDEQRYGNREIRLLSHQGASLGQQGRAMFFAMLFAVVLVLLLACINVANILYSRANERSKETAIRAALGAPSRRLTSQMMWESVIICAAGGVLAILIAQLGLDINAVIFDILFPNGYPFFWQFSMDGHILLVCLLIILFTAFFTGIFPSRKILKSDFNQVLRDGTRGAQSKSSSKINKALVILEVALSCALLTTAAIIATTTNEVANTDYGIDADNSLTARISLPEYSYSTKEEWTIFFQTLFEDLKNQPGVEMVAGINPLPAQGALYRPIEVEGFERVDDNDANSPHAFSSEVHPGALAALNVELVAGRHLALSDDIDSQKVVVVTDTFVNNVWSDEENVIGRKVKYIGNEMEEEYEWMTVVGVIKHVVNTGPFMPAKMFPTIYTPMAQNQWRETSVILKGEGDPYRMLPILNESLKRLDKDVPAYFVRTFEEVKEGNTSGFFFISNLFNLFAVCALLLAATGIYGVIANTVQLKTHELGIRRAMGAKDTDILLMLFKQGWTQLLIGMVIGMPVAFLMSNTVTSIIGGTPFWGYVMLVLIPIVIGIVVTLATYIPAKRAIKMEPVVALRHE